MITSIGISSGEWYHNDGCRLLLSAVDEDDVVVVVVVVFDERDDDDDGVMKTKILINRKNPMTAHTIWRNVYLGGTTGGR